MGSSLFKAGVAEALGVFLLTFVGGSALCMNAFMKLPGVGGPTDGFGLMGIALAHGAAIMIGVYAFASRSGAHINPAVTIGLFAIGKVKANQMFTYVLMQLVGGVLGGIGVWAMFGMFKDNAPYLGHLYYNAETLSMVKAIGIEAMITFVLMITVLMTAVDAGRPAKQMFGICIGAAVTLGILIAGPYTGAAMNPARYFGTAAVAGKVDQLLVYFIGPIIGAVIAAFIYKLFLEDKSAPAATE
ncbi:MAG: aquaporin family protein [Armatimonadota bacterium]|nr:aquaporin family protein [Armatimonadota bacterium]